MQLGAGIGGSAFANGYPGLAMVPGASTVPEGPARLLKLARAQGSLETGKTRELIGESYAGDTVGAVHDIQETLRLEPRHFGAWRTLERIAEAREDWKAAYDAWRHVLDIDPRTPNGEDRLKDLKRKAFGDNA